MDKRKLINILVIITVIINITFIYWKLEIYNNKIDAYKELTKVAIKSELQAMDANICTLNAAAVIEKYSTYDKTTRNIGIYKRDSLLNLAEKYLDSSHTNLTKIINKYPK